MSRQPSDLPAVNDAGKGPLDTAVGASGPFSHQSIFGLEDTV